MEMSGDFSGEEVDALFEGIANANEDIFSDGLQELSDSLTTQVTIDKPPELAEIALALEPASDEQFGQYMASLANSIADSSPLKLTKDQSCVLAKASVTSLMRTAGPAMVELESYADSGYGQLDDAPTGNHRDAYLKEIVEFRIKKYNLEPTGDELDSVTPYVLTDLVPMLIASEPIPKATFQTIFNRIIDKEFVSQKILGKSGRAAAENALKERLNYVAIARFSHDHELLKTWEQRAATLLA